MTSREVAVRSGGVTCCLRRAPMHRRKLIRAIFVGLALVLVLSGGSGAADARAVSEHAIPPAAVDPSVGGPNAPYLALAGGRRQANGRLFVFLPGTGGTPSWCQLLL